MNWQIHNVYGLFHVITGILAVTAATIVMLSKKGTRFHKRVGYTYVASMVVLNVSAWGVMEFFPGKPGPFHVGALISLTFVILGMYPAIRRGDNWLQKHYRYINGSVIGLFAAFFVEAVFRSFSSLIVVISLTIGLSTLVTIFGTILIKRNRAKFFPDKEATV